jgi:hypothetical protein
MIYGWDKRMRLEIDQLPTRLNHMLEYLHWKKYEETLICAHLDGHSSRLMAPLWLGPRHWPVEELTRHHPLHDSGDRRMWNWLHRLLMIAGHGLCHGVMRGRATPWTDVCRRRC